MLITLLSSILAVCFTLPETPPNRLSTCVARVSKGDYTPPTSPFLSHLLARVHFLVELRVLGVVEVRLYLVKGQVALGAKEL